LAKLPEGCRDAGDVMGIVPSIPSDPVGGITVEHSEAALLICSSLDVKGHCGEFGVGLSVFDADQASG